MNIVHWICLSPPQSKYSANACQEKKKCINLFQNFTISFISDFSEKICQRTASVTYSLGKRRKNERARSILFSAHESYCFKLFSYLSHKSNRRVIVFEILYLLFSKETYIVSYFLAYCSKIFHLFIYLLHKCNS